MVYVFAYYETLTRSKRSSVQNKFENRFVPRYVLRVYRKRIGYARFADWVNVLIYTPRTTRIIEIYVIVRKYVEIGFVICLLMVGLDNNLSTRSVEVELVACKRIITSYTFAIQCKKIETTPKKLLKHVFYFIGHKYTFLFINITFCQRPFGRIHKSV